MTFFAFSRPLASAALAAALLAAVALGPAPAHAAAIVTTAFGSNEVLIYPTPNANAPNPTAVKVTGLPAGAHPGPVSCFDPDTCLVGDFSNFRVFVIKVSTASVVDTIATGFPVSYSGGGTLAVNPAKTFALAIDPFLFNGQLTVIAAPFTGGSPITTFTLSGAAQGGGGTQAIAFGPTGRAFVCTGNAIVVFEPPYTAMAFSIPLFSGCSQLATSPDGNTLFAPQGPAVNIFTAPFSAASTPAVLNISGADMLAGAAVTADGTKALVVDSSGTTLWAVSAPFTAGSTVQPISLPAGLPNLRQIAISPDTQLAILTGGGSNDSHLPFVRPPFTTAGATSFDVFIEGGIGTGGVTFLGPAGPPGPPPQPCGPVTVSGVIDARDLAAAREDQNPPLNPLAAALLPSSRSVRVGCPATAFVTVINGGAELALSVGITPATQVAADFLYQTTNPQTNALIGTPNTPIDIPAGQLQTYVVAFTPRAAFDPTDISFIFAGLNTAPPPTLVGINTLLLSASVGDVPDIVALAATAGNTGIVNLPAASNVGAFAVATVNLGLGASITVSADTGGAPIPIGVVVCKTDLGGNCTTAAAPSVTTFINGGETPTFAFFVSAAAVIPFDPAGNRIFARFKDGGGTTRGSTSVAVRTN